jgi:hypothetical protein
MSNVQQKNIQELLPTDVENLFLYNIVLICHIGDRDLLKSIKLL